MYRGHSHYRHFTLNKFETHLSWCHRYNLELLGSDRFVQGRIWAPPFRCWRAAAGYQEMLPPPRCPLLLRWMSGPCCWACSHMGNDVAAAVVAAAEKSDGDAAGCCWWFVGAAGAGGDGAAGKDEAARGEKWSDVRHPQHWTQASQPKRTCQSATCPPSACSERFSGCCKDLVVVGTSSGRRALHLRAASLPPSLPGVTARGWPQGRCTVACWCDRQLMTGREDLSSPVFLIHTVEGWANLLTSHRSNPQTGAPTQRLFQREIRAGLVRYCCLPPL